MVFAGMGHVQWAGAPFINIDIWFTFKSLTDGVCHSFYLYWLMGKGMVYGGLPFPGTGRPVPDVDLIWNV